MQCRLGKNKLHKLHEVQLFFKFSAKMVNISAKFGFLKMQSRNYFKNVIFIACKWCIIFRYYVNSMAISYSYCQKKKKNAFWLNISFTLFWCIFKFVVIHVFFSTKFKTQHFRVHKKMFFSKSCAVYFSLEGCPRWLVSYLASIDQLLPLQSTLQ